MNQSMDPPHSEEQQLSEQQPQHLGLGLLLTLQQSSMDSPPSPPPASSRPSSPPSSFSDPILIDNYLNDDEDDERAEQIITEDLKNLVINLSIKEQHHVEQEERGWGVEADEEQEKMAGGGFENELGTEDGNTDAKYDMEERDLHHENGVEGDGYYDEESNLRIGRGGGSRYNGYNNDNCDNDTYSARRRMVQYPLRLDAEDCSFYMKTGACKFGSNCKFNHPPRRRSYSASTTTNQGDKEKVKLRDDFSERQGQTECKYYLTSGGCKYGKACKYNHNREKNQVAPAAEFNFLGLPIRLGEKECPYYMRTGSCKYGSNCRFHHPDPTMVTGGDPSTGYGNGGSLPLQGASRSAVSPWSSPRALNETASFVPIMYPATQGHPSGNADWNRYQAPGYSASERSLPTPPAFAMNNPATDTKFYSYHQQQIGVEEFPERPGQPECSYFMKTGDCRYKSHCKFHHPKSRTSRATSCALSEKGLPLRPDQTICSYYNRYGICKFGPACKFDHPENFGNLASPAGSGLDQPPFGNSTTGDGVRMSRKGNRGSPLIQQAV